MYVIKQPINFNCLDFSMYLRELNVWYLRPQAWCPPVRWNHFPDDTLFIRLFFPADCPVHISMFVTLCDWLSLSSLIKPDYWKMLMISNTNSAWAEEDHFLNNTCLLLIQHDYVKDVLSSQPSTGLLSQEPWRQNQRAGLWWLPSSTLKMQVSSKSRSSSSLISGCISKILGHICSSGILVISHFVFRSAQG